MSAAIHSNRPLEGVSVLAIDDDREVLELVKMVLEGAGANVVSASGAKEALNALRRCRADLIVSDIMMPVTDGCELLKQIRRLAHGAFQRTPAMALSAAGPILEQQALDAGFQRVESKPIAPDRLVYAVTSLLCERRHCPRSNSLPKLIPSQ